MRVLDGHTKTIFALAFSADSSRLASGGQYGWLRIHNLYPDIAPVDHTISDLSSCASLAFHPKAEICAAAFGDRIVIFDPGQAPNQIELDMTATSIAFADNGRYLVVGCGDSDDASSPGMTLVYQTNERYCVHQFRAPQSVLTVACDPQGKLLIWAGGDRRVTRWDLTKQDFRTTMPCLKAVRAVAMCPQCETFASTDDYGIRIHDARSLQLRHVLTGHKGRVDSLAYLPDGRLLSGSWDNTVRIWDPMTGHELSCHNWEIGGIRAVAVSPDGLMAAAGSDRGTIVLWDLHH